MNQELRTLASIIGDEIKRARRLHDPISNVGQGGTTAGTFDLVDTSTAGCIVYGYQDTTLSDAVANEDAVNNYEAIYVQTTGGVGSVVFAKGTSAVTCTTGGTTLNSPQLDIRALTFACVTTNGTSISDIDNTTALGPLQANNVAGARNRATKST